jgi:hypothetical protein
MQLIRSVGTACLCFCLAMLAHGQSVPNQVHTPPQADPGVYSGRIKVDYPTRYEPATVDEIREVLERVRAYVDQAAPVAVVDGTTGEPVPICACPRSSLARRPPDPELRMGRDYVGMLLAAVTGDARFQAYTSERLRRSRRWPRTRTRLPAGTTAANFPARARHLFGNALATRAR